MPNFDPAQDLGEPDSTVQTVPLSLPNQFGAVVAGPPTNPNVAPGGNPLDVVTNSSAIVDPKLRAAYEAAHPVMPPAAPVAAEGPPEAPGAPVLAAEPSAPAPVVPIRKVGGAPAGGMPTQGGIPGELSNLDRQIDTNQATQAAAITNQGDVEAAGLAQQASAKADQADIARQQAADLAAEQVYVRERQAALNAQDTANLQIARDKTIPEFWDGREGAHAGATIGVVLAGIGAGFLGSNTNQATQVIQHNIDGYFDRKKEEVDNLYKYATQQGLVNDKARSQYAQTLTDMLQQHAAVLDAAKERVEQVALESQSEEAKARAATLAAQLGTAAAKEHLQVQGARREAYDANESNISKRMEARAALIRASAEANRAKAAGGGGDEKADIAAFNSYVKGPHGKEADEINRRVEALNSAHQGVAESKSVGEVVAQVDKAIAADAGAGTRGVSMGQLHSILPNLVSASGAISNKVSQNWDGSAGREFKDAAARMIETARKGRLEERKAKAANLEKNLALTPHALKNPAFAHTSAVQLYPELEASAPAASSGGTKTLKMPDGSIATFDASGKRIK